MKELKYVEMSQRDKNLLKLHICTLNGINEDMFRWTFDLKNQYRFLESYRLIADAIKELKKALSEVTYDERENIKGEWQTVSIGCDTNEIRCTACKQITSVPASRKKKLNFCPECGADMRR